MEWFIAVVIVAALGAAAIAAAGGLGGMAKEPVPDVYRQDLPTERPISAADIDGLRFGTALRGYAMGQVDDVLERLAREISDRDELITQLRAGQQPATAQPEPHPDPLACVGVWPHSGPEPDTADGSDRPTTDLR